MTTSIRIGSLIRAGATDRRPMRILDQERAGSHDLGVWRLQTRRELE
jgi:hypothetical protein